MTHAVIIAGGKGERLGLVRKAELRIGNRRLIDRVADSLGPVASRLLAVGPSNDRPLLRPDLIPVTDLPAPVGGPLAGLAATIAALHDRKIRHGLLVSCAVDTPFLPRDVIAALTGALGDAPAAYATWGDQFYPPNAIWRVESLADLPQQVLDSRAPPSLKALQRDLGAVAVDWSTRTATNPFANLNTVADLIALGRLA